VKFDPMAMSYAKKTETTFFVKIDPDDHDIDGKKPKLRFFMKIYPTTMISAKNTEITFFVKFDPTAMSYAKKPKLRFFVKIDPTTMI
jgi:peptide methionine sulfoxide reductase MsrA